MGAVGVLRALARGTTDAAEQDVLLALAASAEAAVAGAISVPLAEGGPGVASSFFPRHRLMIRAAGRAYVPVLIAFEAEQARAAANLAVDTHPKIAEGLAMRAEVLHGLAATSRERHSGNFRAAVFGANDGLVSNLALVVGMSATGVSATVVLAAGLAGLLAGALSMAAGEYISVRSARELLHASRLDRAAVQRLATRGAADEQLALIYRARGMSEVGARRQVETLGDATEPAPVSSSGDDDGAETDQAIGQAWGAAISSFFFFASGALIPILPYLFGLGAGAAMMLAIVLVGIALLATGAAVGLLSGASAARRALRQLAIGYGAATVTYLLGLAFGAAGVG